MLLTRSDPKETLVPLAVLHSRTVPDDATQVRFSDDRRWWTVRARDDRFTILTRSSVFGSPDDVVYTIVDAERAVRGPCNQVGQGWHFRRSTLEDDARQLLTALNLHRRRAQWWEASKDDPGSTDGSTIVYPEHLRPTDADGIPTFPVEVSYHNNVPVHVEAAR